MALAALVLHAPTIQGNCTDGPSALRLFKFALLALAASCRASGRSATGCSSHEDWISSFYRVVVTVSLTGLDSRPPGHAARALHDRAPVLRRGNLRLRRGRDRRGDRARRSGATLERAEEATRDRRAARPLHHLRLRPGRPPRRRGAPRLGRAVRRPRLQRGGARGRARSRTSSTSTATAPRTPTWPRRGSTARAGWWPRPTPTSTTSTSRSRPGPLAPTC